MTKKYFKLVLLLSVCILIFAIIFASCCTPKGSDSNEEKVEVYPEPTKISESTSTYNSIAFVDHNVSGIHYRLFTNGNGAITVVNVTKDSLEIKNLE